MGRGSHRSRSRRRLSRAPLTHPPSGGSSRRGASTRCSWWDFLRLLCARRWPWRDCLPRTSTASSRPRGCRKPRKPINNEPHRGAGYGKWSGHQKTEQTGVGMIDESLPLSFFDSPCLCFEAVSSCGVPFGLSLRRIFDQSGATRRKARSCFDNSLFDHACFPSRKLPPWRGCFQSVVYIYMYLVDFGT